MRYKFIILFLFISFIGKAQVYQLMPQYGYDAKRMNFDSTIQIPTFCGVPKLASNVTKKGALAFDSCNNRFYFFNPKFQSWDTIKSADATLFVKYTDTSSMLTNYVNSVNYGLLKLGKTISVDTSVLSTKYLRIVDTANKFVSSVTKLNDSTIRVVKDGTTTDIAISAVSSASRLITQVWNNTGATILRGSVVYISGRHSSNLPTIALAEANNEANSYKTFALVDGDIADNSSGYVIQAGKITGLNLPTSSYTDGDILYLSPTVPGGYTITKPLAPNHIVKLGSVTRAHPTQGSIEIKIENGWQLDELSDVQIAAVPADSTLLQFSRVDSLWHDVSPLTAMGNRFVKTTDSASMLTPYLRSNVAAATYATISQNNLKLNISDTANMLLPYLRKIDTTNRFVTSLFRKTASDSVFFVRGGTNNFAFRDSIGGGSGLSIGSTIISATSGSVLYAGTGGALRQSNTQLFYDSTQASLNIGTNTNVASAILNLSSTTKGFLQPRMTTTQMNAISTPATGLSVFNTTDSVNYTYRGTGGGWSSNVMTTGNQTINGQKIFNDIAFVGIGIRGNQSSGGNIYIDGSRSLDGTINYRATTHNMSGNLTGVATATVSTLNVNGGANTVSTITGASGVTSFRIQNTKSGGGTWYFENNRNAAAGSLEITNDIFTPAFTIFPSRNVSIGSNTEVASARLNVESTTQGFMPPRMTTTQRDLISSPAAGLIIYNTTTNKHQGYNGTTWNDFY